MNARYILVLLAVLTFAVAESNSAQAQCGAYGGGYWGAFDVGDLYRVLEQNVPHYAAFPPVYYSAPVPRTYGYSPFAYPPGVMTPDIEEPAEPAEIINPYYSESAESEPEEQADRMTEADSISEPLVITNPYISSEAQVASFKK